MTTLDIIERVWTLLPPPDPSGTLETRELQLADDPPLRVQLAIDHTGFRHLLIPSAAGAKHVEDRRSQGVQLQQARWGSDEGVQLFTDLVCLKPHLNGLFSMVIYDILNDSTLQTDTPDQVCLRVLNRWRELLADTPRAMPERTQLVGLLGELTILHDLAQRNAAAIKSWIGPMQGRYDFLAGRHALEVKTLTHRQRTSLTINGLSQLEAPPDGILHLVVIHIEETPGSGNSLASLVENVVLAGINRYDLYRRLLQVGITSDMLEQLHEPQWSITARHLYHVNDAFPRLTRASFVTGDLPRGVVSLNYTIDLTTPPPAPLSEGEEAAVLAKLAAEL